jgi:hypothetical protein
MTAILGEESEPQPDQMLRLLTECGGQSRYNEDEFLVGAPEFISEVSHSSRSIDMNRKRLDYLGGRRPGVPRLVPGGGRTALGPLPVETEVETGP